MDIDYVNGAIVDVTTTLPHVNKLTRSERMALFAIDHPNQAAWIAITAAERGTDTEANAIAAMVSQGLITQARADEIQV